jgi:hypothetical protein
MLAPARVSEKSLLRRSPFLLGVDYDLKEPTEVLQADFIFVAKPAKECGFVNFKARSHFPGGKARLLAALVKFSEFLSHSPYLLAILLRVKGNFYA